VIKDTFLPGSGIGYRSKTLKLQKHKPKRIEKTRRDFIKKTGQRECKPLVWWISYAKYKLRNIFRRQRWKLNVAVHLGEEAGPSPLCC